MSDGELTNMSPLRGLIGLPVAFPIVIPRLWRYGIIHLR
jgi:hypothetical protein